MKELPERFRQLKQYDFVLLRVIYSAGKEIETPEIIKGILKLRETFGFQIHGRGELSERLDFLSKELGIVLKVKSRINFYSIKEEYKFVVSSLTASYFALWEKIKTDEGSNGYVE